MKSSMIAHESTLPRSRSWMVALRGFAKPHALGVERCNVCGQPVGGDHDHLLDIAASQLLCACPTCAADPAAAGSNTRRIPREVRPLTGFRISDAQWDSLLLPIGLAFFVRSSAAGRVAAMYPSPAGTVESLLPLDAWQAMEADNPELARIEPDVEALLVHRVGGARKYYVAPIDRCYALAGLLRREWRGFSGGQGVWDAVAQFFAELDGAGVPAHDRIVQHA